MQVIYTGEEAPNKLSKSLFLAGPSTRNPDEVESWRDDALDILRDRGFDGVVFNPEYRNKDCKMDYDAQIEWEDTHLNMADVILFWIPRDLSLDSEGNPKLPAYTTNIEWGTWAQSGKAIFGAPPKAPKNEYIRLYAEKYNVPCAETLTETLDNALEILKDGAERSGGERFVPLFIWNLPSFQSWYQAQVDAGNRLEDARLLYSFRPRYGNFVFLWILKAKVYVAKEDRVKENEFVLSRPDISSVCLYYDPMAESIFDMEVVLVKEFRTPASTEDGFVRELPSGSAKGKDNQKEVAASELHEETAFYLDPSRLKEHGARQLAGTFSAHKAHLFSAELTKEEIEWFKSQDGVVHGNEKDTERTFVEVYTVKELVDSKICDWTTFGMILSVIC